MAWARTPLDSRGGGVRYSKRAARRFVLLDNTQKGLKNRRVHRGIFRAIREQAGVKSV